MHAYMDMHVDMYLCSLTLMNVYVRMCVCIYVYMFYVSFLCMYVCMYVCVDACIQGLYSCHSCQQRENSYEEDIMTQRLRWQFY